MSAQEPGQRPATVIDVAEAAGVSVATVSRTLRQPEKVSPKTREKVMRAVTELDYVASPAANALVSGRTHIIAVIVPLFVHWFFATIVESIERAVRAAGYHVLLFDLWEDGAPRLRITRDMLRKRVDGVVVVNLVPDDEERQVLQRLGLPVVMVGDELPGSPTVGIDDRRAMRLVMDHLVSLGHSDVGHAYWVPEQSGMSQVPAIRLEEFQTAAREHGLTTRPEWMLPRCYGRPVDAVAEATRLFSSGVPLPSAIVGASDETAYGIITAARRFGIDVPGDLSVTGIDDHAYAELFDLTTVRQDVSAQGAQAAARLLEQLTGSPANADDDLQEVRLVVRGSTATRRDA
ncbi:LacI family DNA-binding transcriptional regulator [Streptomyces sp. NPDC007325]|uniref:LacI family DNA-binding transcriptional regulator n=1 Tax=Streptomyces sp. NPDC007325 TaxID=3154588 RepID=UPI0033C06612